MDRMNVLYLRCEELFVNPVFKCGDFGAYHDRIVITAQESLCLVVRDRVSNVLQCALWRVEVIECHFIGGNYFRLLVTVTGLYDDVQEYIVNVRSRFDVRIV